MHAVARRAIELSLTGIVASACGDGAAPVPVRVEVLPDSVFLVTLDTALSFTAFARDETGRTVPGVAVSWSTSDPAVLEIDAATGAATPRGGGTATVTAQAAGLTGSAWAEVYLPAVVTYEPGTTYYGRRQYVEYQPGELPLVLSAPHGGSDEPDEIADRTWGVTSADRNTQETARAMAAALASLTGRRPHLVISRLHRRKLDPNREIDEAAQGNVFAEWAWNEFHGFIDTASALVVTAHGQGLYLDIHGHGHELQRIELGYLLSGTDLARSDTELSDAAFVQQSSIRTLAARSPAGFVELLRGPTSLGGLLEQLGYATVPSPSRPDPGANPYFRGGYDTRRHGSLDGGPVSGVQVELHWTGLRDSSANRQAFAATMAQALLDYFYVHFGVDLRAVSAPRSGAGGGWNH